MAGHEIRLIDVVRGADGLVAEAQVADGDAARLFRIVLEVRLDILVGVVADNLGAVLVGAHGAVAAKAPELALLRALRSRVGRGLLLQREIGDVVRDADGEARLRGVLRQLLIHGEHTGGRGVLRAQAIAAADDGGLAPGLGKGAHHIQMQGLGIGARLLRAVQHGNFLRGGGHGCQQVLCRERTVQAHLHKAYLFALGGEVVDNLLGHVADRAHGNDDALGVFGAVVLEQAVTGAQLLVHLAHVLFHHGGHGVIELVAGLAVLEEDVTVLVAAARSGVLGVQRMVAERLHGVHVRHFLQVVVIPHFDFLDLVRGAEAVEKVQEGHAALNGGKVRHCGQVHHFLGVRFRQHGKARLTAGIYVGVVAEDVQRMAGHRAGRHMEHRGQQLARNFVHVRDHQKQALRRGKRSGEGACGQAAVHGARRARLRLHLHDLHFGAEDILLVRRAPLVHHVGHRARRGDGVDAGNLCERICHMRRSGVAVHRFLQSWHFSSSGSLLN